LLALAKRSETEKRSKTSSRRRQDDPPSSNNLRQKSKSDVEPVVTEKQPAKQKKKSKKSKEPVKSKELVKRKRAEKSSAEPVETTPVAKKTKRVKSPGDQMANQRANLTILNPTAGKNTNVAKGSRLQIKIRHTVYNATVTKVLGDGLVMVRTKDDCTTIADIKFKIIRLTEEQAKSGRPCGFTSKKANVGFPVEGAHDS
jgi:outer membrane biosynthesis protein TonB